MNINKNIERIVYEIEDQVDSMEESLVDLNIYELRTTLSSIRRKIVSIRRYIVPQREVLSSLYTSTYLGADETQRWALRDSFEKLVRIIEDIDLIRDRAALVHDEINNKMSENMNKTMFMLSIVATIFLPLGFLTGLLGINVGGLPGVENPLAFYIVCVICLIIVVYEYMFFKKRKCLFFIINVS